MKYYPLASEYQFLVSSQLDKRGLSLHNHKIMAVRTGEDRSLKRGEWYISGAIPEAYRAPNDLNSNHVIAQLVIVKKVESLEFIEEL